MAFNPGLVLSSTSPASSEGSLRQGIRGSRLQDGAVNRVLPFEINTESQY